MFVEKTLQKRYLARLKGKLKSRCGIISLPLSVNPDDRPRQVVDHQFGKEAITYYEVIEGKWGNEPIPSDETLLALYPLTGRTHQLRVHCASPIGLDHPIVGDTLYDIMVNALNDITHCSLSDIKAIIKPPSKSTVPRLMLHAESITLTHPYTKQAITIESRL
jgi:tRNA pseudouridine32 synthase/23S rRNA pseudouridine746 synthase